MSHELRTPLNSIIGFTHRLIKRREKEHNQNKKSDREYDALLSIHSNGKHLHHLINELLDLSKIEAGEIQLAIARVNVSNLTHSVISDLSSLIRESGLELINNMDDNLVIEADEAKLRQILTNLIGNALKFTPQGSVTIEGAIISRKDHTEHKEGQACNSAPEQLKILIKDTGIGIDSHDLKLLFEPYNNISNVNRHIESTGLGLAITQKLVQLHQGNIKVTSQPGQGSEFTVSLPPKQPTR